MTLFRQHFRGQRTGLLVWLGANIAVTLMVASLGNSASQSQALSQLVAGLPANIQALFGLSPGLSPVDSFVQAKLGFTIILVFPIYACLLAISAVTREVDRHTADFLLALPIDRARLLLSRWAVMAVNIGILGLGMWVALVAGLKGIGVTGSWWGYFWMVTQAWFLGVAVGSLALLASVWIDDYGAGTKYTLAGVGALFALDLGMRVNPPPWWALIWNPFAHVDSARSIVESRLLLGDAAALVVITALALALAVRFFADKQIRA